MNVGVVAAFTVTLIVVVDVAHCPASGVKVYVVVAVLFIAGVHVPVIEVAFVELVGKVNGNPLHIADT